MRYGLFSLPVFLNIFKWFGGLPFALDATKPTTVEEDSKLNLFRPCLMYVAYLALAIFTIIEHGVAYGPGEEGNAKLAETLHISQFEVMLININMVLSILLATIAFVLLVAKRKSVCTLYQKIHLLTLKVKARGAIFKSGKLGHPKLVLWLLIALSSTLIGCGLYSWANMEGYKKVTKERSIPQWRCWLYGITVFISSICSIANPMLACVCMFAMDPVNSMSDCLNGLSDIMSSSFSLKNDCLKIGLDVCDMAKDLNEKLSMYYIYLFFNFMAAGLMYTYGSLDIIFTSPETLSMMLSAAFMCYALVWVYFMYIISESGNDLKIAKENVLHALDNHFVEASDKDAQMTIYYKDLLAKRLDKMIISPYNYFEIGNNSLLGVFTTLITYLIIILQFRAA